MNSDMDPAPGVWVHMDPRVDATATVTPVMPSTFPNLTKNMKICRYVMWTMWKVRNEKWIDEHEREVKGNKKWKNEKMKKRWLNSNLAVFWLARLPIAAMHATDAPAPATPAIFSNVLPNNQSVKKY